GRAAPEIAREDSPAPIWKTRRHRLGGPFSRQFRGGLHYRSGPDGRRRHGDVDSFVAAVYDRRSSPDDARRTPLQYQTRWYELHALRSKTSTRAGGILSQTTSDS